MLRVAEHWYGSDVGRQRQGNEDNYFVQSPLFVVADGMGGAQAGEVASAMAAEAFRGGLPNGTVEAGLVGIIREANHRIYEAARSDSQRQGMGTTCTAAYVAEDEVVLAHVGDSRAYLFRGGELTRLTRDHSLVGELVDRGKLTEDQAEVHPQRSVITRALGPEPDVQVDTERIAGREGDVFLVCSDGLTSMIREHTMLPLLQEGGPLAQVGRKLIAAANDAGGRDNITVILFRLEEIPGTARGDGETIEQTALGDGYETYSGPATRPLPGDEGGPGPPPAASDATEAHYRATGTVALSAVQAQELRQAQPQAPAPEPPPRTAPPPAPRKPPRRRRRPRMPGPVAFVLVGIVIVLVAGFVAVRGVFFVGLDHNRAVTIYRGVPYELPAGIHLYTTQYRSGVTIDQVPPARRSVFTNHKLRSLNDATDLVRALETGRIGSP